jgi:hypothetical protein
MSKKRHKHVHLVKRGQYKSGTKYFKCELPGCTFLILASLIRGRLVQCWKCRNPFVLTANDTRWARPVCKDCRGGGGDQPEVQGEAEVNPLEELMKEIG